MRDNSVSAIPYDPLELQNMIEQSYDPEDEWIQSMDLIEQLERVRRIYTADKPGSPLSSEDRARRWELMVPVLLGERTSASVAAEIERTRTCVSLLRRRFLRMLRYDRAFQEAYQGSRFCFVGEAEVLALFPSPWDESQHHRVALEYFRSRCSVPTAAGDFLTHESVLLELKNVKYRRRWFPDGTKRKYNVCSCLLAAGMAWACRRRELV